jgi:glycosyltransferase involved in cell wall biosynthesis
MILTYKDSLVSIIIPCYNAEDFLVQALESVLWQTYTHWECILIDDGSTDRSAEIYKSYAKHDARFKYEYQNNAGPAHARNVGTQLAQGAYIQFLDADDVLMPERLQYCVEQFNANPEIDIVYTDYVCFSNDDGFIQSLPAKIPFDDIVRSFMFYLDIIFVTLIHSFLFRRKVIDANRFDTTLHSHGEDIECWIRIALAGARFLYIDRVLAVYRYSEGSLTQNGVKLYSSKLKTIAHYQNHPKAFEYASDLAHAVQHFRERLTIAYFMESNFKEGFQELKLVWNSSTWRAKVKFMGWIFFMSIFSKRTVIRIRSWLLLGVGKIKGENAVHRRWIPPPQIDSLLRFHKNR